MNLNGEKGDFRSKFTRELEGKKPDKPSNFNVFQQEKIKGEGTDLNAKGRVKSIAIMILCLAVFLSGCTGKTEEKETENEPEKIAVSDGYTEIEGECRCYYAEADDILSMLKHGTGIVMFTWEDCPWCHRYIKYLNEAAVSSGLDVLVYDIHEDRENGTEFYKEVCTILEAALDEKGAYDAAGKVRVYIPDVTFVSQGEIIGHDNETSMIDEKYDDIDAAIEKYWSSMAVNGKSREENLKEKLSSWCCEICEALEKIENRGCTSCPVKE